MIKQRDYQQRTIDAVRTLVSQGTRSVLVVSPPGSGKTWIGAWLAEPFELVTWVAHRRELVTQAASKLRALRGDDAVGLVLGGVAENRAAPIQVGSVQAFLERGIPRGTRLLVLDEAHHYVAPVYRALVEQHANCHVLGLTATPERDNGSPLGDIFEKLVVAAQYSELIRVGHLVKARVYGPPQCLGRHLAMDPLAAFQMLSEGKRCFWFSSTVPDARRQAARLQAERLAAEHIDWETPIGDRETWLSAFAEGTMRTLTNVYIFAEGTDVPAAEVALSTRSFEHVSTMLQAFGRVLRPYRERRGGQQVKKRDGIIIDLTGATNPPERGGHGSPDADRDYSLSGRAIVPRGSLESQGDPPYRRPQRELDEQVYVLYPGDLREGEQTPVPTLPKSYVNWERVNKIRRKHGPAIALSSARYMSKLGE